MCCVTLWNIKTFQSCQMCIKPWHQHPVYCRAVTTTMLLHSSLGLLHTSCNTCLFVRSPWCSKSDDFYGFSLIFAEPGLEKEVGKIKTILLSLCFALQSSMSIFETVFILKLDSRYDCKSPERLLITNGKQISWFIWAGHSSLIMLVINVKLKEIVSDLWLNSCREGASRILISFII